MQPRLNPITIPAGALGQGLPSRDLVVSPQHCLLFADPRAELVFGKQKVLIAAIHLVGHAGIKQQRPESVVHLHVMLDHQEVICADGAWSESFQQGLRAIAGMGRQQNDEMIALIQKSWQTARALPCCKVDAKGHEARVLLVPQSAVQSLAA